MFSTKFASKRTPTQPDGNKTHLLNNPFDLQKSYRKQSDK